MPSDWNSVAPMRAPAMRAKSCVVRENPMALTSSRSAMVSPTSALRITRSDGRTRPASAAMANTAAGSSLSVRPRAARQPASSKVEAAHRRDHGAAAEPVAEGADRRRHKRAEELERGEGGLEHHRPGRDQHEPVEDQRLHLEGERGREVARPLEPEAPHGEGREDAAQTGGAFRLDVGNRS